MPYVVTVRADGNAPYVATLYEYLHKALREGQGTRYDFHAGVWVGR